MREPDSSGPANCPRCGATGIAVVAETMAEHLTQEACREVSSEAFFCPAASCDVVYFDSFERFVETGSLVRPVYPKDPDAPICSCFGLSRDDIEADLAEGGVRRVRDVITRSRTAEAQCHLKSASGQCCAGEVQRYYYRRHAELNSSD